MTKDLNPRVYVACLSSYNNGVLHGMWIDADQDVDDIKAEVAAMLRESKFPSGEEYAIHDYEDFPDGIASILGEYPGLDKVADVGAFLAEHGTVGAAALSNFGGDLDEATEAMENYQGAFDSLEDFAADWTEETGGLEGCPKHLQNYIDFKALGRDMELGGDIWTVRHNGSLHVFLSR